MKKSRFTDEQIIGFLKQADGVRRREADRAALRQRLQRRHRTQSRSLLLGQS